MRIVANRNDNQLKLRLPSKLKEAIEELSKKHGTSMNTEILKILVNGLKSKSNKVSVKL